MTNSRIAATLEAIPVFYCNEMVADIASFSPSAGKPRDVDKSWQRLGVPLKIIEPVPVTPAQLYLAHDRDYVDGVLSCRIANGFGSTSAKVAASLPWTSGAMLSSARAAIDNGFVATAPVSGFHHASFSHGGGYCTFNALLISAQVLLREGVASRIGILDCDYHLGDGSEDIIKELQLSKVILHFTTGRHWHYPYQAQSFLRILPKIVAHFAVCDLLLYQAGADAHIDDPLGGWMTTKQLAERDRIVFETAKRFKLPVAWCLAGGYLTPLRKTLDIHDGTMLACARTFAPVKKISRKRVV